MALWNTFNWSDGTLWGDAQGESGPYTSFIDKSAYRVSLKVSHTNDSWPGSLASFVLQSVSAEIGIRPQLPDRYEAFIDRNEETQRISVRVSHTANEEVQLLAESEEGLLTESGEQILVDAITPFTIEKIHGLVVQRSKRQPSG